MEAVPEATYDAVMHTSALPRPAAAPAPLLVPALLACYLVWGSTYLAIRVGVMHLPPMLFAGVRFLIAGFLLAGIVFMRPEELVVDYKTGLGSG